MIAPPEVNWANVAFDDLAAEEAAVACDRLRAGIADALDWSVRAVAEVAAGWQGGVADEFGVAMGRVQARLRDRDDELARLAAALREAAELAAAEQASRERQREAWHEWQDRRLRPSA